MATAVDFPPALTADEEFDVRGLIDSAHTRRIFGFGSNLEGRHGAGTALFARRYYGAIYGQAEGLQGDSYAIPTKVTPYVSMTLQQIKPGVDRWKKYATEHPEMIFHMTRIGCGRAGYKDEEMGPMFIDSPDNCEFDPIWADKFGFRVWTQTMNADMESATDESSSSD